MSRKKETLEKRSARKEQDQQRHSESRKKETSKKRFIRQKKDQLRHSVLRAEETSEQHAIRLQNRREQDSRMDVELFEKAINTFADNECEVCTKMCYPNQFVRNAVPSAAARAYLPRELSDRMTLGVCKRCQAHITSSKPKHPSRAYWNKMQPGEQPDVIKALTYSEKRLLSRMIPFTKVVKYNGIFGQFGFRGQAVLFAQDLFEVTDNLVQTLPRPMSDMGLIVITEHRDNLEHARTFTINRDRLYAALRWLKANNPLYNDVIIDESVELQETGPVRFVSPKQPAAQQEAQQAEAQRDSRSFKSLGKKSSILRASWHQGDPGVFTEYAGVQYLIMVLANIVRASLVPPGQWTKNILEMNMMDGQLTYQLIRDRTRINQDAFPHWRRRLLSNAKP